MADFKQILMIPVEFKKNASLNKKSVSKNKFAESKRFAQILDIYTDGGLNSVRLAHSNIPLSFLNKKVNTHRPLVENTKERKNEKQRNLFFSNNQKGQEQFLQQRKQEQNVESKLTETNLKTINYTEVYKKTENNFIRIAVPNP